MAFNFEVPEKKERNVPHFSDHGGYCTKSKNNSAVVEFYDSKKTMFAFIQDDVLHTASTNCIRFADPKSGMDTTLEGMADLLMISSKNFLVNLYDLKIKNDRGSKTLVSNLRMALKEARPKVGTPFRTREMGGD